MNATITREWKEEQNQKQGFTVTGDGGRLMNWEQIRQRKLKPRQTMTEEVTRLYDRRIEARKQKDFAEADRLRVLMECLGFGVANEDLWRGGPLR